MPEFVELPQANPTRILVVDDDDAFRESVCAAIARDDAMVLAAQVGSAEGAREAIANGEFDVALVDLGLPDGNGIDLIREIANMLHLSAHTVATHVKHIYRKLAVHSRTEAVFEAGRMGLL